MQISRARNPSAAIRLRQNQRKLASGGVGVDDVPFIKGPVCVLRRVRIKPSAMQRRAKYRPYADAFPLNIVTLGRIRELSAKVWLAFWHTGFGMQDVREFDVSGLQPPRQY